MFNPTYTDKYSARKTMPISTAQCRISLHRWSPHCDRHKKTPRPNRGFLLLACEGRLVFGGGSRTVVDDPGGYLTAGVADKTWSNAQTSGSYIPCNPTPGDKRCPRA